MRRFQRLLKINNKHIKQCSKARTYEASTWEAEAGDYKPESLDYSKSLS